MNLGKLGFQQVLEEGVGVVPTPRTSSVVSKQSRERLAEGWALRPAKKVYRFSEKRKAYLTAKFIIGQSTGRKVDSYFSRLKRQLANRPMKSTLQLLKKK